MNYLEKQREMIMNKLHTAQDNVLQIFQPEASAEDLKNLGQVPESPEEELGTLVNKDTVSPWKEQWEFGMLWTRF